MVNKPRLPPEPAPQDDAAVPGAAPGKWLTAEARRALKEAQARRETAAAAAAPAEINGPSGEEPTRYGDWERKGIAVDF